ncbi:sensor domain-containing diguanylate cyclase [Rhodospirillum rubrum]|uniref:diguanylate cyclase n=1 Tax=Rhodospirillum rubrum (strain ATCC 11170 / ATH 1.1.1 / DSM 467 / LMG 4362 / NCIMB 8255 / S1) TaxID=269796 RepID=Q2RVQ9_RHORT|nr:sensor domain-containing diguanylate cyclase [Rhodospirillum rubrum]ABC21786.1 Putative diguanylate cyclase (GGDEF domain) [Rhodospirillum rubrum ATCC 11170]AEO47486.1 diguanylate cyclase [Rhodospirillum rubrum F11]MBK5953344.1 GGDEF domain-containing protein [Rhodospirillum rubrum]QXG81450.1 sensor domain-containing diguanylate cyclase [Rhodospirillum rubrum]HCF17264.1 GGDEF domain-containing protein [Rhodospirillum rubrum]
MQIKPERTLLSAEATLIASGTIGVIAILGLVTVLLANLWKDTTRDAERSASNLIRLIDADVRRTIELYDLALSGIIEAEKFKTIKDLSPEARHALIFSRVVATHYMGGLLRLNAAGDIIADSTSLEPRVGNFADRDYFQLHKADPDLGLLIGRPIKVRLSDQEWRIPITRRVSTADGRFDGVVMGAMRVSYFDHLFGKLDIGSQGSITLLKSDGTLLARRGLPGELDMVGRNGLDFPNFHRIINGYSKNFSGSSAYDHIRRIYSFAHVENLPLIVVVALSANEVYGGWIQAAIVVGGITFVLCLGVGAVVVLLLREFRQRRLTESALSELAVTDGLTGLCNRRHLEEVLRVECARSARNQQPLALLMIDVDHFKAFNDRHGHRIGDGVLVDLAVIIRALLKRPADVGARYGGEEFAVILPDTDLAGGLRVAEAIRARMAGRPPVGQDLRAGTVSIGVVSRILTPGYGVDDLVMDADKALYAAKGAGRNRVVPAADEADREDLISLSTE